MFLHHQQTIDNVIAYFQKESGVLALVLGGSIAHGYAKKESDVDIMIVVDHLEYLQRKQSNTALFYNQELCSYPNGYVDGKYIDEDYLRLVAAKGNEPTRYAFKDCRILFSNSETVSSLIQEIVRFDFASKDAKANRFYAQTHAWKWYFYEGKKHRNDLLVATSINNFILFASRVVLNHNDMLYPYHKWLLKEVERAPLKPSNLLSLFNKLIKSHQAKYIEQIMLGIKQLRQWEQGDWDWPPYFLKDIEITWMEHEPYIADI